MLYSWSLFIILYIVACVCQSQSPNLSLSPFPLGNHKFPTFVTCFYNHVFPFAILQNLLKIREMEIYIYIYTHTHTYTYTYKHKCTIHIFYIKNLSQTLSNLLQVICLIWKWTQWNPKSTP